MAAPRHAIIHGFRSSFRDWAGNETGYPRELIEAGLAHVVGNQSERAYRRSDAIEERRSLIVNSLGRCCSGMELIGWIVDYLAMKRLRLKPTLQNEFMMALAIIMVLAALIYYGRLVWLLFLP